MLRGHAVIMRSILNSTLTFGMVRVPIKLYAATASHDLDLHQYHAADAGRIRYEKTCEIEDESVPAEEIVKGVETDDGHLVVLDEDDLKHLPVPSSKRIEVIGFVPEEQIDPIYYERSYYLGPGAEGTEPYLVLRDAMLDRGTIAIVRLTMRQRESLAAVRPRGKILMLNTMLWADEISAPEVGDLDSKVRELELDMAHTLIDAMAGDFHPEEYQDAYQEALREAIDAKRAGRPVPKAKDEPRAKVVNLVEALTRSVERVQSPQAERSAKKAAKKATRKKTSAKQPATRAKATRR